MSAPNGAAPYPYESPLYENRLVKSAKTCPLLQQSQSCCRPALALAGRLEWELRHRLGQVERGLDDPILLEGVGDGVPLAR
jgi:hypothetical protein